MLKLILTLIFGGIMVYFAQHNLTPITLQIGNAVYPGIPLFYVIIGSMVAGLGLAYLVYLIHSVFMSFTLRGKDQKIKQAKNEIAELTKKVHKLEIENDMLKTESGVSGPPDSNAL